MKLKLNQNLSQKLKWIPRCMLGLSAMMVGNSAYAVTDVCTLAFTPIAVGLASATQVSSYKAKLAYECGLSEKYRQMVNKARQKYGLSLEQISQYQAMRFIRRADYESAKTTNTPVSLTYPPSKAMRALAPKTDASGKPVSENLAIIWDGFTIGIRQMEVERTRLAGGGKFQIADLARVHAGFFTLSDEPDDQGQEALQGAQPGILRPPVGDDAPWWPLRPEEVTRVKENVGEVNDAFGELDLATTGLAGLYDDLYMNGILSVRDLPSGGTAVYGGDSRANEAHLQKIFAFLDEMLTQARQGQHMVWRGQLMTPAEVAFLTQQYLVDVRPFFKGNGRVSRLVQEMVLTSFALPPGSSGDLMDQDVLTTRETYYDRGISKTRDLLLSVDNCLERVYPDAVAAMNRNIKPKTAKEERRSAKSEKPVVAAPSTIDVSALNPADISYECRLLK